MRVAIDAGHGGHDSGAVAPDGTEEKDIVLEYARTLSEALARVGETVKLIRVNDDFIGLSLRAYRADDWDADCLVSIHANASSNESANGAWVIYDDKTSDENGKALARFIFDEMDRVPGVGDRRGQPDVYPDGTGWVGNRQLTVISASQCPAVLVELGFLTNPADLADLKDPDKMNRICNAIATGIRLWGMKKGFVSSVPEAEVKMVDNDTLYRTPKLPSEVKPLLQRSSPSVVNEYSSEDESFGCLIVRFLQAAEEDQWIRSQLGPIGSLVLGFLNKKLADIFECDDSLVQ